MSGKDSSITKVLNIKAFNAIRWCTPSIDPDLDKVREPYLSDISISYQSLGIPSVPSGIFKNAYQKAAKAYGADHTLFSVNGSTGSNFMVLRALSRQIPYLKVLTMRNIHKSVLFACEDYDINLMFLPPSIDQELQIFLPNSLEEIMEGIKKVKPDVLLITNPTYEGITLDVKGLIKQIRKNYPDLIVYIEEAWGSHLHFSEKLPISAMDAGADICIQSTHKQGGALQQSGMIHWKNGRVNKSILLDSYDNLSTSSPSFILLASLDAARSMMEKSGSKKIDHLLNMTSQLASGLKAIPGLHVVETNELRSRDYSVFGRDETKIIVEVSYTGFTGYEIAKILEDEFNIIVEKYDMKTLLFLTPFQATIKDIEITIATLRKILKSKKHSRKEIDDFTPKIPRNIIKRRELSEIAKLRLDQVEKISLNKALGRISAEDITIYPPGIPITVKGEEFTQETLEYYKNCREYENCTILAQDQSLETVTVVK